LKPYYQDNYVTIYHGDCREILPTLPDNSVDLVLTDPPYGVDKAEWDSAFDLSPLLQIDRLTARMGLMPGIWNVLKCPQFFGKLEYKWILAAHLINGMARSAIGFGNWIPCLVYDSDGSSYRQDGDCREVIVGTTIKPDHPSPKPESAMAWFIARLSIQGETILDPFLGSGTTAYCAKKLNRKCIGIEIEEKYCEIAANRCRQSVMELNL
jgi:site-specific DNA-methyltransferase (adenine-specific)